MKASVLTMVLATTILVSSANAALAQRRPAARPPAKQQWEMKVIDHCHEADRGINLTTLGEEGWEFIGATQGISTERSTTCQQYYFKRAKSNEPKPNSVSANSKPVDALPKSATSATNACSVQLENAPVIRGLRLGMSLDELLDRFPGSREKSQVKYWLEEARRPIAYGLAMLDFHHSAYPNQLVMFEDVESYEVTLFNNKVVGIKISFRNDPDKPVWTQQKLINQFAEKFQLPPFTGWTKGEFEEQRLLRCAGFVIQISVLPNWQQARHFAQLPLLRNTNASLRLSLPLDEIRQQTNLTLEKQQRTFRW